MKVTVKVDDRYFEVEIENLHTRPIVATVEGETFEIWPDGGFAAQPLKTQAASTPGATKPAEQVPQEATPLPGVVGTTPPARDVKAVHAPIPGVIVSINVEEGQTVEVGQPLCVLEAMKMKNSIRAPRAGTIAEIVVAAGDHVQHHDLLMEYAD